MTEQKIKICYLDSSKLLRYKRNVMQHSDAQVAQIADSIKEFGWTNPVLIDEQGEIIAGHGRLAAAEKLGIDLIPTITLCGLTDAQKRAYRIADNKLPLGAGWDDELLKIELSDLLDSDFNLDLTGFDQSEIDALFNIDDLLPRDSKAGSLVDKFLVPPFSVLNAREGWWQGQSPLGIFPSQTRQGRPRFPGPGKHRMLHAQPEHVRI